MKVLWSEVAGKVNACGHRVQRSEKTAIKDSKGGNSAGCRDVISFTCTANPGLF